MYKWLGRNTLCVGLLGFILLGQTGCSTGLFQSKKQVPTKEINSIATKTETKAKKPPKKDWFILLQDKEMSKISTNMSMILAQKVDKHVSVYRKNLIQRTSTPIFSWNERFSTYESIFVPPCIAISPNGKECIYSTSTQFLLRDMQTDATIVLAEVCDIDEGFLKGYTDPSKIQGWQYYYSDFHQQPIIGVYQPRYPKWSFDGRYFSVSIPIFREGAGGYVFDRDAMKDVSLQKEGLLLQGGGHDIQWAPNAHEFVVASSQTGWSKGQFVLADLHAISNYIDLKKKLPVNLEEVHHCKYAPVGRKIAFLGTLHGQSNSFKPILFEADLVTNQVDIIHKSEQLDSTTFPYFYSQDAGSIYYLKNHADKSSLYHHDLETQLSKVATIFTVPQPDTECILADSRWHNDTLFLTFYMIRDIEEDRTKEGQEFYTQVIALDPFHEELLYQSNWIKGFASILRIEKE